LVRDIWGEIRVTPEAKRQQIAGLKEKLARAGSREPSATHGRAIFSKNCASCHRLFDAGEKIGPDLTGSQRKNLDYVLENVVDPSAVVGRDYQVTLVQTDDGRVMTGIVVQENETAVTIQTSNERVVVPKDEIENRVQSSASLMPDDLLTRFSLEEIQDLLAYLASDKQIAQPEAASSQ
jgi:putative heme-binding domain-containing protein